jgi:hypothetical protein
MAARGAEAAGMKRDSGGIGMAFLVSQFLFILFGLVGLLVWASADMPLAVREIAINTRRDQAHGSSYVMIKVLSVCLKIFAVLLWISGIVSIVMVNLGMTITGILESAPSL